MKNLNNLQTVTNGKSTAKIQTKVWEKEDKKRVYITLVFSDGGKIDLGFINAINGELNLTTAKGYVRDWKNIFVEAYEAL